MQWLLVGLGNPGKEYEGTRHNIGRDVLSMLEKKLPPDAKVFVPDTYMNDSGKAVGKKVASKKAAERLVVIHDDLDLPLGRVKLSFGSGAGGHRGVRSVQTVIKNKDFVRIRIGISPTTSGGKLKKPLGEEEVVAFVLGKFKSTEQEKLKKVKKTVADALEILLAEGKEKAMTEINGR
jgi:peptidyl-tRNA hydrolase, PTH1 family